MKTKNQYQDGNYSFENKYSYARKNIKNDHVKLKDGTLVHVDEFVKKNNFSSFKFELINEKIQNIDEALKQALETVESLPDQQKHLDARYWLLKRIKEAEKG